MARLTINGKTLDVTVDPNTPLLWAIREQVGLTIAMPHAAVLIAAGTLAALTVSRWLLRRTILRRRAA